MSYEYNRNGRNVDSIRYNRNTTGRHKSKKKGSPKVGRALFGAMAVFFILGFASEYSRIDGEMSKAEGVTITQNYSPSGGIDVVTNGEKQHNAVDVLEKMFGDIKTKTAGFEEAHSEGFEDSLTIG